MSNKAARAAKPEPVAPVEATTASSAPADAAVAPKKPTAKVPVETATVRVPALAPLGFDPKTLDPRLNARLKIDDSQMPKGLDFTVEMNGKLYFQKVDPGSKVRGEQLFIPPGVHELRVTARSGAVQKISNTVSTEFKARKQKTLTIELRLQGRPREAGIPQGLYASTQIVATLK